MKPVSLLSLTAVVNYLAGLHGFILALIIHRKSHHPHDANALLSWLLGLSSAILAGATFYNGGGFRIWPHLVVAFDPFVLLIPPLLYLYVQSRIHGALHWRITHALHLLPALVNLTILFPFYTMPAAKKIDYFLHRLQHPHAVGPIMAPRIVFPFFYVLLSILVLMRHRRSLPRNPLPPHQRNLLWLWHLLLGILAVWSAIALIHVYIPVGISEEEFSHLCNLLSSLFIFALGYRVLLHPEILHRDISGTEPAKYEKTGLAESDAQRIWHELELYMGARQPFLEPTLSLKELAERIAVPQHQLSQIINQKSGAGFYGFVNGYRIDQARRLMERNPQDKLLTVAFASGFQSLSTFNRVFKDMTGLSPSRYREKAKTVSG